MIRYVILNKYGVYVGPYCKNKDMFRVDSFANMTEVQNFIVGKNYIDVDKILEIEMTIDTKSSIETDLVPYLKEGNELAKKLLCLHDGKKFYFTNNTQPTNLFKRTILSGKYKDIVGIMVLPQDINVQKELQRGTYVKEGRFVAFYDRSEAMKFKLCNEGKWIELDMLRNLNYSDAKQLHGDYSRTRGFVVDL